MSNHSDIIDDVMERLRGYSPAIAGPIPAPDLSSDQIELHIIMSTTWLDYPITPKFAAQKLGRAGGLVGGPARAAALSPERRSEIASIAARARWAPK